MKAGKFVVPGNVSSQFISGLAFSLPLLKGNSTIEIVGEIQSKSYIDMTLEALRLFGIKVDLNGNIMEIPGNQTYVSPGEIVVEGDWSNSAFWLCGAGAGRRSLTCAGLNPESAQGDKGLLDILRAFGHRPHTAPGGAIQLDPAPWSPTQLDSTPQPTQLDSAPWSPAQLDSAPQPAQPAAPNPIGQPTPFTGQASTIEIDVQNIPDLVPAIAVLACTYPGTTKIVNAARLRLKESDRLETVCQTLNKLGGKAEIQGDSLIITGLVDEISLDSKNSTNMKNSKSPGPRPLKGGTVDSHNDHRIAMMAAIATAISSGPIVIENHQAVNKSYPDFFRDLETISTYFTEE